MIEHQLEVNLKEIITDHSRIFTEAADLCSYGYDASFGEYMPDIVVQPLLYI